MHLDIEVVIVTKTYLSSNENQHATMSLALYKVASPHRASSSNIHRHPLGMSCTLIYTCLVLLCYVRSRA